MMVMRVAVVAACDGTLEDLPMKYLHFSCQCPLLSNLEKAMF